MIYVFDASFIGVLIIPDEKKPQVQKMYSKIKNEDERHAPHLIWYEITNAFRSLIRNKRFTLKEVSDLFPLFSAFRLKIDIQEGIAYSQKLLNLSTAYGLSSYDAAYLELAERKKAVLCTLDDRLSTAAKKHGVKVLSAIEKT